MRKPWMWAAGVSGALIVSLLLGLLAVYARTGAYGLNALLRRGGAYWISVTAKDTRLSPAVQAALGGARMTGGALHWAEAAPGFEIAEQPIYADGVAVDGLMLARVDPERWRFSVHSRPEGDRGLDEWMAALGAALVVNGSYFGKKGEPDTPVKADGRFLGPPDYEAGDGAFVAGAAGADVVDLAVTDWRRALAEERDAMVSYPMLIGADGSSRAQPSQWFAARSFVGRDHAGRIVIGTTRDATFSLDQFAAFLKEGPLSLVRALGLDGGPLACQAVALGDMRRRHCATMAVHRDGAQLSLLRPVAPGGEWALPIALAVFPRSLRARRRAPSNP